MMPGMVVNTAVINGDRQYDWVDKLAVRMTVNNSSVIDAVVVITVVVNTVVVNTVVVNTVVVTTAVVNRTDFDRW
jgi:hypothetical protein